MNFTSFFDSFFEEIAKVGLDVSDLPMDHVAYQASSKQDYEQLLPQFIKFGQLVSEEIIGGRRVAVIKLKHQLKYKDYNISALELIEPRASQQCKSELQHAEFVVDKPFEEYLSMYPKIDWDTSSMDRSEFAHLKINFDNGLTLKFLQRPILELLAEKKG